MEASDFKSSKLYFVYSSQVSPIEDLIDSLNIFDDKIELNQFSIEKFNSSNDVYLFGQMWLSLQPEWLNVYKSERFVFFNVEMLTEKKRFDQVIYLLQNNVRIADYSTINIAIMKDYLETHKDVAYSHTIIHLPYQFNDKENRVLKNTTRTYEFDVGVINAIPPCENNGHVYQRTALWNDMQLNKPDWKILNINGWGVERDRLISQCKIILNVHNFAFFNVFEHVRCDRLIFSDKIVISEDSINMQSLDIFNMLIFSKLENILQTTETALQRFETVQNSLESMDKSDVISERKRQLISSVCQLYSHEANPSLNQKLHRIHSGLQFEGNLKTEIPEQLMALKHIRSDDCVLELGGSCGRNSCLINSILSKKENHVVVEPSCLELHILRKNRDVNGLKFQIENSAISVNRLFAKGWYTFDHEVPGSREVRTISFNNLKDKYLINFNVLIIDNEGNFPSMLRSFSNILDNIRLLIIEHDFHSLDDLKYFYKTMKTTNFRCIDGFRKTDKFCPGINWVDGIVEDPLFVSVWARS